ncbi:PDZ domain-containing protein [uncultured Desulfuromonas sp.]|uniref:PDZ domain-containing protein n=1 Tax=uncultured Desulfuromonas sp. TaxID=181013 RepID=UPI00260CF774|nr:PDZ domain-containing protein [uncultured Desulfuromonas sp.]
MRKLVLCGLLGAALSWPLPSAWGASYCRLWHVPQAPATAKKEQPYLGVTYRPEATTSLPSPFVCPEPSSVETVLAGSSAERGGVMPGDILLALGGQAICRAEGYGRPLRDLVAEREAGDALDLDLLRGGERLTLRVTLGLRPVYDPPEADHSGPGACSQGGSLLAEELHRQGLGEVFGEIRAGLGERISVVHNPGGLADGRGNPWQNPEVTHFMRHPLRSAAVAEALTDPLAAAARPGEWRLPELLAGLGAMAGLGPAFPLPPKELSLESLLALLGRARNGVKAELDRLPEAQLSVLRQHGLAPWEHEAWDALLDASLQLRPEGLLGALAPLAAAFNPEALESLRADLGRRFADAEGEILYQAPTAAGPVIVGGRGPNVYPADAALILDLGGDDLYLNNAGGSRPGIPVAVVIDWGGDDRYIAGSHVSQGAGYLGGGFLLDLAGDDIYRALDGSQGSGHFGLGLLLDSGGRDRFESRRLSQGVGQVGLGLLLAGEGPSSYLCGLEGQGLGFFGGAGALVDGGGDDAYRLGGLRPDFRDPEKHTVSMGQGFGKGLRPGAGRKGASGGSGLLLDLGGDDTYSADYFAQGASYYFGLGILRDLGGDDRYLAGRYAQGAGIHATVGVLLDETGDDSYYASFGVAQGMGHDFGLGVLRDAEGRDSYHGGALVQGAATSDAIGILADFQGDDSYSCSSGQAFAEKARGMGVWIDLEPKGDRAERPLGGELLRIGVKKPSEGITIREP